MSPVRSPYLAAPSRGPAVVVRAGPEHAATSAAIAKVRYAHVGLLYGAA